MSAYVVEKNTINKIIYIISNKNHLCNRYNLDSNIGKNEFGEKLLKMNIEAVNQRYNENDTFEKLLDNYKYSILPCNCFDAYKSTQCLRYQCSEGNVSDWPLYKELEYIMASIAGDIIQELPKYNAASWD